MKSILIISTIFISALLGCRAADDQPEFRLARIINDGMVLQQDKPIKIWGWAKPGAEVSVMLTRDAATGEAVAVEAGSRAKSRPANGGDEYSEEAKKAAAEKIKAMQEEARALALDRKLRQLQIDLPILEKDLFKGNAGGQFHSKLERISVILDELQSDEWLSGAIHREYPEVTDSIEALKADVKTLQGKVPTD